METVSLAYEGVDDFTICGSVSDACHVCCSLWLLRVQGARVHVTVVASAPRPADWRQESAGEGGRQDQSSAG